MKKITCIIFFLIQTFSFSQKICVMDSLTKERLPYTTIKLFLNNIMVSGGYCDEKGEIVINKLNFDSLEFSEIGYYKKSINKKLINDTIFLNQNIIELKEVVINKYKQEVVTLGYINNKKKMQLSAGKGSEIVVFIDNSFNQSRQVKTFLFNLKRKKDFKTAIRIHFYKKKINKSEPSEEIGNEDIIGYLDNKIKGTIEIDITNYNIEFPIEGIFVGIEWLGFFDLLSGKFTTDNFEIWDDIKIDINDNINKPLTFFRSKFINPIWKNSEFIKKEFANYINFKNLPNASFGIKVYN